MQPLCVAPVLLAARPGLPSVETRDVDSVDDPTAIAGHVGIVLAERGWKLDADWRERIRGIDDWFGLDTLLRRAVTVASFEAWTAVAKDLIDRAR